MKPWAVTPACENNYAVRKFLTVFSTCTPLCRRAKICLYLRHRAFRSEQSRHGWKDYYRSFALTKNSKYVKMRPPGKAGRPSEWNNTANAGRIVSKPKRQEDSSCVFAYRFYRGTCHRRDAAEKRKSAEHTSAQVKKKSHQKAVRTVRRKNRQGRGKLPPPVCRSQSAAPDIRGIAYSQIRRRADHRTPAEPSAAEFSGLVSAVAHTSRGQRPPYRSVLTWHK